MPWKEYLQAAKDGDQAAQDELIMEFYPLIDNFVKSFGGFRDPDELRGLLDVELVETIRTRLRRMTDNRLDRFIAARFWYTSMKHIRRESNAAFQLFGDPPGPWDENQEELDVQEYIQSLPPSTQRILDLLLAGHSVAEAASKLGISKQTVYNHLKQTQQTV